MTIAELLVKVSVDNSGLNKGVGESGDLLKGLGINAEGLTGVLGPGGLQGALGGVSTAMLGAAGLVAAAVAAGKALYDYTIETYQAAGAMYDMSVRTGVTAETLQQLQYATGQVGVSFESITSSISIMTRGLDNNEKLFRALGVSIKDAQGNFLSTDEIFNTTIARLSDMENATERNKVALQLFGRGAYELVPLLAEGSDGIEKLKDRASELGYVMSDNLIQNGDNVADMLDEMDLAIKSIGFNMAESLIPTFSHLFTVIVEDVIPAIKAFLEEISKRMAPVIKFFTDIINNLIDFLSGAIDILSGIFTNDWGRVWNGALRIVLIVVKNILDGISFMINGAIGLLNELIRKANGLLKVVGIAPLKEVGLVALSTLLGIDKLIEGTYTKIGEKVTSSAKKIKVDFATLTDEADEAAKNIADILVKENQEAIDSGISWFEAMYGDIPTYEQQIEASTEKAKKEAQEQAEAWSASFASIGGVLNGLAQVTSGEASSIVSSMANIGTSIGALLASGGTDIMAWAAIAKSAMDIGTSAGIKGFSELQEKLNAVVINLVSALAPVLQEIAGILILVFDILGPFIDIIAELMEMLSPLIELLLKPIAAVLGVIRDVLEAISDFIKPITDFFGGVFDAVGDFFGGIGKGIGDFFGGIGDFFGFADGTDYAPGGLSVVGERGPELMYVPRGAQIFTNQESRNMLGGFSPTVNIYSPKEVSLSDATRMMTKTMRDLAFAMG